MTIEWPSQPEGLDVSLISDDVYGILSFDRTMGFVHKAGNSFVALVGDDLQHCVEAGQSLSWDEAVAMVQRASGPTSHPGRLVLEPVPETGNDLDE